jgi:hypothetical protein
MDDRRQFQVFDLLEKRGRNFIYYGRSCSLAQQWNKLRADAVNIAPAGTKVIDINASLQSKGIAPYATLRGYVELRYNWPWVPLCATIRNVDTAHSLIFTYGLGPLAPQAAASGLTVSKVAEGVWWKQEPAVSAFVALSNPSSSRIPVTVQVIDDQGSELESHTVAVSPHGTKLVQISSLDLTPRTIGGVHITYQAPSAATLLITGGLQDEVSGYSAAIPFVTLTSDPPKSFNTTITELGLMVGASDPMMNFPAGTRFTPYSVVRNVTKAPMSFTPTLWWMQGGAARSYALPAITLAPNQSQALDVISYLSSAGLERYNGNFNLVLDAQGERGGLLMAAGSVDEKDTYVFEVVPRGVTESASKSLSYWSTGNGDDTMVTIWNPADEAQDLVFKLFFTGGHYSYPVHLAARATQTLNISDLIENQTPDADGDIIPESIHEGSAKIAGSAADNQEILVAVDAGVYNVKKATCGEECWDCDGADDASVTPSPFTVTIDGSVQMQLQTTWDTGDIYYYTSEASWSGNGVTVNSSGVASGQTAGSASVSATYDGPVYSTICLELPADDRCPLEEDYGADATGTVNDPTPTVTGVSGSPWQAGETTSITISGKGFGTAPTVSISGPSGSIPFTQSGTPSDTSITGSVNVPDNSDSGSATVNVTSHGYGGSGYMCTDCNNPNPTGSNNQAQIQAVQPPTISGTAHDIYYFGPGITSQSSGATQFQYSVTLTAQNATGAVTWTVTSGQKEVTLSQNGNAATVTSSGNTFSSTKLDVSITATASGKTSDAYQITTHIPYLMVADTHTHTCNTTYGYVDVISYNLQDQLGTNMSIYIFDYNENFTTGFVNDNNSGWLNPSTGSGTDSQVNDTISGTGVNSSPPPNIKPVCSGNGTQTQHATQQCGLPDLLYRGVSV